MPDKMRFTIWLDKKTVEVLKALGEKQERPVGWLIRKAVEDMVASPATSILINKIAKEKLGRKDGE
ncbi:MAG: ribbon-helix-helix protein, CopG family [Candidatus Sulfotelmatobacter sp.]|jgi:predicted transcriptional regulator